MRRRVHTHTHTRTLAQSYCLGCIKDRAGLRCLFVLKKDKLRTETECISHRLLILSRWAAISLRYQDGVTTHAFDQFKCQFKSSPVSTVFLSPGGMQMLRPEGTLGMHGRLRLGVRVPAKTRPGSHWHVRSFCSCVFAAKLWRFCARIVLREGFAGLSAALVW